MTDEQTALARRAVACMYWEWMDGMAVVFPDGMKNRVTHVECGDVGYGIEFYPSRMADRMIGDSSCIQWREYEMLPDLTDPATLGCLLALVREAYRDPSKLWEGYVEVRRDHRTIFYVMGFHHDAGCLVEDILAWGCTEVEALVCALETAP